MSIKFNPFVHVSIVPTRYNIIAGGPTWLDTDISGCIGNRTGIVLLSVGTGNQNITVGARPPGDTTNTSYTLQEAESATGKGCPLMSKAIAGHIEFYQNATWTAYYSVVGFIML